MKGDMGENLLLLPPFLATFGGGGGQEAITCSSRSFLLKTTISLFFIEKFRFFLVFGRIRLDQICVVHAQSAITTKEGVSSRMCACILISPIGIVALPRLVQRERGVGGVEPARRKG